LVAGATSATTSVLTGGLACILGAAVITVLFPALDRYGTRAPRRAAADKPT
jgi:hypothetical protein